MRYRYTRNAAARRLPCILFGAALAACSGDGASSPVEAPYRPLAPASIDITPAEPTLALLGPGQRLRLSAIVRNSRGVPLDASPVRWTSSDTALARVDDAGQVEALAPAPRVLLTASTAGVSRSVALRVVLYANDFREHEPGPLSPAAVAASWNGARVASGPAEGRVSVVTGPDAYGEDRSLRVAYPAGSLGPAEGGALWTMPLGDGYREMYASYRFRADPAFDWVRGGKLPGLAGGAGNTGGVRPNGRDGWSGRMMWIGNGGLIQYVYHADQPGPFGQSFSWQRGTQAARASRGVWHQVQHRVVMNTPGERNGIVQAWLDGELVLDRRGLRFRDVADFAIDAFQFSTFFGGNEPSHAATRDGAVFFDDFVIAPFPLVTP